jgi:hypothetical protein
MGIDPAVLASVCLGFYVDLGRIANLTGKQWLAEPYCEGSDSEITKLMVFRGLAVTLDATCTLPVVALLRILKTEYSVPS